MSQGDVLERLFYVPELSTIDLSVVLDLNVRSVTNSISRLKKARMIVGTREGTTIRYSLTNKGRDFAERYYL